MFEDFVAHTSRDGPLVSFFINVSSLWVFQADKSGHSFAAVETNLGWSL